MQMAWNQTFSPNPAGEGFQPLPQDPSWIQTCFFPSEFVSGISVAYLSVNRILILQWAKFMSQSVKVSFLFLNKKEKWIDKWNLGYFKQKLITTRTFHKQANGELDKIQGLH